MSEAEDRAAGGVNAAGKRKSGRKAGGRGKKIDDSARIQPEAQRESTDAAPIQPKRRGRPAKRTAVAAQAQDKNNADAEKKKKTSTPKRERAASSAVQDAAESFIVPAAEAAEAPKRGRRRSHGTAKNIIENITDNKNISDITAKDQDNGNNKDTDNKNIIQNDASDEISAPALGNNRIKNSTDNKKAPVKNRRKQNKDTKNITDTQNITDIDTASESYTAPSEQRGKRGRKKKIVASASTNPADNAVSEIESAEQQPDEDTAAPIIKTKARGRRRRKNPQIQLPEQTYTAGSDDSLDTSESSAVPKAAEHDVEIMAETEDNAGEDKPNEMTADTVIASPERQQRGRKHGGRGGAKTPQDDKPLAAAGENDISPNVDDTALDENIAETPEHDESVSHDENTTASDADNEMIGGNDADMGTDEKTDDDAEWISFGNDDSAIGPSIGQVIAEAGFNAADIPMPPRRRSKSGKRGKKRGFKGTNLDVERIKKSLARHPVKPALQPKDEAAIPPEQPSAPEAKEPDISAVPTSIEPAPEISADPSHTEEIVHADATEHASKNPWHVLEKSSDNDIKPSGRLYYQPTSFNTVDIMASLKGFAPMGMLFVLMDILDGHEEGLIHINQLAQALDIGKPSLLAQLDNLEAAGLIRTVLSSRAGRHIELLTSNLLKGGMRSVFPDGISGNLTLPAVNVEEVGGQFSMKQLEFLYSHLKNCGIEVVSVPDETSLKPEVSQTAAFLGKYLKYVQQFYNLMKTTLNDCREFRFSLANVGSRSITHTLNFCKLLKSAGFLSSYSYKKSLQYSIVASVKRMPEAINFISGGWLEHYIRDRVVSILTTHPVTLSMPYAFLKNPKVILPGGEDFELDFLLCVGRKIFWMEAKTGEYLNFLQKYSRVKTLLGLTRTTAMLVSVEPFAQDSAISLQYGLSCCTIDEFQDVFRINLVRELQQSVSEKTMRN